MATHSSILAWRIPWTEEPGGLQSMGSQRVNTTGGLNTAQRSRVEQLPRETVEPTKPKISANSSLQVTMVLCFDLA